ncbi:gstB, partial [Symbiodinium natans]
PAFLTVPARTAAAPRAPRAVHAPAVGTGLGAVGVGAAAALAGAQAFFGKRRSRPTVRNAGPILFGSQGSRSPLVNWYLHEIGQEFEMVQAAQVDRTSPDYPHPFGKIPALQDGDAKVFESGAILMYLADKYGGLDTPAKRAEAGKWVVWANASLDPICFKEDGNGRVLGTGLADDPPALRTLDAFLADREFLLGSGEESFSVADVAVGSYLLYVPLFFPDINTLPRWPNVQRYMLQLLKRPAYAKAFGEGTAQKLQDVVSRQADSKLFGLF